MPETAERKVFVCDGCSSWTSEEITREELLTRWGWIEDIDDDLGEPGYVPVYCPECA